MGSRGTDASCASCLISVGDAPEDPSCDARPGGTRPSAPQHQRYASTAIFGAAFPREGKGAALVLPFCNTVAMNLHLAEISQMVEPGRHAVVLLDQAGWHLSNAFAVPDNLSLLPLPAKCPELNAMANIWEFMRDNWPSNRVFPRPRRHHRSPLQRMDRARQPTLAHHVDRTAKRGTWVLINASWHHSVDCVERQIEPEDVHHRHTQQPGLSMLHDQLRDTLFWKTASRCNARHLASRVLHANVRIEA
jgi:hypothetical protein